MSAVSSFAGATMTPRRRGIKRLARVTLLGLVAAALTACGAGNARRPPVAEAPAPITGPVDRLGRPLNDGILQVGLLLPLSGSSADLGRDMQRAAQMAIFDTGATGVELLPRDSGETAATAGTAAGQVIAEGADIILGPLFSPAIPPVASAASRAGINVVSFSTDASRAGGNVFLFSFLPQQQVERIIQYASSRGLKRIAVVAPATAYGSTIASAARSAAASAGAQIVASELYDQGMSNPQDLVNAVKASQPDAILIADVGQRLNVIAPALGSAGISAQTLGTGQWDTPDRGAQAALIGAWYAAPDPTGASRTDFESRYLALYGSRPRRLATLAYDATALVVRLAGAGRGLGAPFDVNALEDPAGFSGIDGIFRFGPNGLVQRGLAVLQIQPDGSTIVIDSAPQSFTGPIF
jgi:ABC-type branched-subunit amino acid transport system substrate-binding protein